MAPAPEAPREHSAHRAPPVDLPPVDLTPVDLGIAALLGVLGVGVMTWVTMTLGDGRMPLAGDAHYTWLTARSIAFDGDLDLTNQYAQLGDKWGLGRWPASDGTRFPPREIGPSLLMVPGLLLLHALQTWSSAGGETLAWASAPSTEAWLATLPVAALLGPLYLAVRRIVAQVQRDAPAASARALGAPIALATTLGFVPAFYAVGHAGYAHTPDALVCACLVGSLLERRSALVCGALLATALTMRLQNALWLLWPLAEFVRVAPSPARGLVATPRLLGECRRLAALATIASLGVAPQVLLALAHPGSEVGPIRWGPGFFDVSGLGSDLVRVLVGVHGLWSWTPLAAVATLGLLFGQRRSADVAGDHEPGPPVIAPEILVGAAMVLLVATVPDPDGGDAFGARRLAGLTPLLAIGLVTGADRLLAACRSMQAQRLAVGGALALGLGLAMGNVVRVGMALAGALSLRP